MIMSIDLSGILMIDSHNHLFRQPAEPSPGTLYLIPGYSLASSLQAVETAGSINSGNSRASALVGIAPQELVFGKFGEQDLQGLEQLISSNPGLVCGIGEIGIDLHYGTQEQLPAIQKLFEAQLELASRFGLPVAIHSRDAEDLIAGILPSYNLRGIMHAYGGSPGTAEKLAGLGYLISIVPLKSKGRKKVIRKIGLGSLCIETDYPYIGKDLGSLELSAQIISSALEIPQEQVYSTTRDNVIRVLDLNK